MTTIAVLGATSQIAKDFVLRDLGHELFLFSRRPEEIRAWLDGRSLPEFPSLPYAEFRHRRYDAIINFVGSGDPARTAAMGAEIMDITSAFDALVLDYLKYDSSAQYVFLSSGAVYGSNFLDPVDIGTPAAIPINSMGPQDFYSIAKLHAEAKHRAMRDHAIVDVRIFNYFSRDTDIGKRFFVTDMLRAVRDGVVFETNSQTMHRDFLIPEDFSRLITSILNSSPINAVADAFSRCPVEKFELIDAMSRSFGLQSRIVPAPDIVTATGVKLNYFSRSRRAEIFGYHPQFTSLEGVIGESQALLEKLRQK